MKKYILSIDQGTTSSRIVLYNLKFTIVDIVQKDRFFDRGVLSGKIDQLGQEVRHAAPIVNREWHFSEHQYENLTWRDHQ